MNKLLLATSIILIGLALIACQSQERQVASALVAVTSTQSASDTGEIGKIVKTKEEWKAELTDFQYHVLREKGTERAFSGDYWDNKKKGTYSCSACSLPLFDSETKFKSGTGWPSFYQALGKKNVTEYVDKTHGMVRTEVTCGRCDGHLGHIFNDGPRPTGLRYCINSVSLKFDAKGKE